MRRKNAAQGRKPWVSHEETLALKRRKKRLPHECPSEAALFFLKHWLRYLAYRAVLCVSVPLW